MNVICFIISFMLCGGFALGKFVFDGGDLLYIMLIMGIIALIVGIVRVAQKRPQLE